MTNLETLSLSQLVALHNQHAPKPVRKFSDRKTAIARTRAVLPARAGKVTSVMEKFLLAVADQAFEVEAAAKKLGVSEKMVRNCIDQLRRKGGKAAVASVGKGTFRVAAR